MIDEAEIDRQLAARPTDFTLLIAKADLRSRIGDDRAGAAFYKAALAAASAAGGPLPASWRQPIERAQAALAAATRRFESHLQAELAKAGFAEGQRPERFQHSLDLLTGRRQPRPSLQRPGAYFYPDLPERRYYERDQLPWSAMVEAAAPIILAELQAHLATSAADAFRPYLVSSADRPQTEYHGLVDNPAWSTLYIWEKGGPVAELASAFPRTLEVMQKLPLPRIGVRAPSVLFSRLGPGARIPLHNGMLNTRLICHLPLIVPDHCSFEVGGERRPWEVGKLLVFDDSVEHQAWNDSDEDRIILIFDIWRPELSGREREAVTALFAAIDNYPS